MLGDRRRINRLLKQDRRRASDRRSSNHYTGHAARSEAPAGSKRKSERRAGQRRFADRSRS